MLEESASLRARGYELGVLVNGVMSSTTPELHQTWDGSSCCYLSPSMSESMLYLWNWGDEHLKGDESPSSISTACSEAGIRQRTSQLESKRGRPRAEIISHLIVEGSTSPSAIKCTYCNRVFPREKSLQAHLRTHTGTGNISNEKGCDKNVCRNVNIPYVHLLAKQSKTSEIESASSSLHLTSSPISGKSVLADLESSVGPSKQEFLDQVSISGKIRDVQLTNIQNGEQEFQTILKRGATAVITNSRWLTATLSRLGSVSKDDAEHEYRQSMSLVLSLFPGWLRLYSARTQRIFPQHGAACIDDRDSCFHDRPHALLVLSLYSGRAQRRPYIRA
uniref:C2H2-type domain-containing protein n=1 Tax=Timema poppense TaxID=170557 RepID=A0A7R9CZS9_TIMPO|nr:unnamed protein product [Timema poppensis]